MPHPCPFCAGQVPDRICPQCRRDSTAPRRICRKCGGISPTGEQECCHCGVAIKSELRWKIPLIIALFLIVIFLSIILQIATN